MLGAAVVVIAVSTRAHSTTSTTALAKWITQSGGYVGPVTAEQRDNGYRGLFCTQNGVRAGEPLLAVPRSCTLRGTAIEDRRPIEHLVSQLIIERDAGKSSTFASYIDMLPTSVPLLRDWNVSQLSRLASPELSREARSQHEWLTRLNDGQSHELVHVEWAERLCRSRGIAFGNANGDSGLQLVPLLDLANHRAQPPDAHPPLSEYDEGVTVLCATTDLDEGDEATFEYTQDGNGRLLLDYGFAALHALDGDEIEYVDLATLDARLAVKPVKTAERLWHSAEGASGAR